MTPPRVLAVVGATATGKTALGEAIAERLGAEVVCADSRQVFRGLAVGTGKPDADDLASRPHHLFDALAVGERASAGWYARAARAACTEIRSRGRLPVLVGGSGLYIAAAQRGLAQEPPHDPDVRQALRAEVAEVGIQALHARLAEVDAETAARLAPGDTQRIVRALEVWRASGRTLAWWHRQPRGPAVGGEWRTVEVTLDPVALDARIVQRTGWMFEHGLLDEARALVTSGQGEALRALRAVGYDEALAEIEGRLGRQDAMARASLRTRQLAKRQRTWFRHQVDAVRLDGARPAARQLDEALAALAG